MSDRVREAVEKLLRPLAMIAYKEGWLTGTANSFADFLCSEVETDALTDLKDTESIETTPYGVFTPENINGDYWVMNSGMRFVRAYNLEHAMKFCNALESLRPYPTPTPTRFTVEIEDTALDDALVTGYELKYNGVVIKHYRAAHGNMANDLCAELNSLNAVPEQSFDEGLKEALADLKEGRYTTITTVKELHEHFDKLTVEAHAVPPALVEAMKMAKDCKSGGQMVKSEYPVEVFNAMCAAYKHVRTLIEKD